MAEDLHVSDITVVKEYSSKLNAFRVATLACGAIMDGQIRKIKGDLERKQAATKSKQQNALSWRDGIVKRYKPIRQEPLPGSEVAGTSDYDIQAKYQALDAEINEYNRIVRQIHNKMSEIGQRTKTFCTIFDSEVVGYNRRLQDTISIMDSMKNMKL
jgi:hypothetical protein